jgi:hypothetical protein
MADTTFVAGTVVAKEWLNDVNDFVYTSLTKYTNTKDYPTLVAAEEAAYTSGLPLWFSPGVHEYDGTFVCRVPIYGYGATLTQTNTTKITNNAGTLSITGLTDAFVIGLKVDGNSTYGGLYVDQCTRMKIIDVVTQDTVAHGIRTDRCAGVNVDRCSAVGVIYNHAGTTSVPVSGGAADGFYCGGSTDVTYTNCTADGFYRIGFVLEQYSTTKSERVRYSHCLATNGSNCDRSTTEYNTGFWAENTNGADFESCTVTAIYGNTGQTSGRVRGMRVASVGSTAQALNNVTRCKVYGGVGRVPVGIDISTGSSTYLSVTVRDCLVSNADRAIEVAAGYKSIDIRSVDVDDCNYGVLVNAGGGTIEILNIDDLAATNCTFTPDTGIVHIFSAIAGCEYTLSNIRGGWPHVMRAAIPKITVRDCSLAWGSNTYSTFIGADIRIYGSLLTKNASSSNTRLYSASASGTGSRVTIRNSKVTAASFTLINPDGTDCSLYITDSEVNAVGWLSSTVGTFVQSFTNIDWTGVSATWGAYKKDSAPAAATRHELLVSNCRFVSANVADTPLLKGTSGTANKDNPTFSVLLNNTYNTTVLYNFTGGTITNANNTQTL